MNSLEEAKELLAKFYLNGDLTNEESSVLNEFAIRTPYKDIVEDMKQDPKYEKIMLTIELYRGIMREKFMGVGIIRITLPHLLKTPQIKQTL